MFQFGSMQCRVSYAVFLLSIFLVSPDWLVSADLYRWTDLNGVVHFSDQPPQISTSGGKDVKVSIVPERLQSSDGVDGQRREHVIPFKRTYGGMLVDVVINDRVPAKMILDTGATTVKLNVSLLKKLNQTLPVHPRKGKALTAAGVVDVHELFIEKIDVGGAVKRNVQASYIDETYDFPYYDGLLGLSFLSDFKMTVDYDHNVILLRR
jgi:clan AA aspartic protease (TIGR02281 family)